MTSKNILPRGQLFIHHGPKEQPSHGVKGGVAVVLSEELAREFNNGKCKDTKGGEIIGTMRFMCVSIKLKLDNINNKMMKHHVLTLIPCYSPHSGYKDDEFDLFAQSFVHFYSSSTPAKNATIIIGASINASKRGIQLQNKTKTHQAPMVFRENEQI